MQQINMDEKWLSKVPIELHGHRKKLNFFINSLEKHRNILGQDRGSTSVLEVGCSNGRNISFPLAEYGYQVTGVDIHQPSIDWANKNNNFSNASFLCQDFSLFSSDEKFDAVILSDILEHVDNPLEIVQYVTAILKKNGVILICIPNGFGPYEIEQRVLRITRLNLLIAKAIKWVKVLLGRKSDKQAEYNYDSGHVQFFKQKDIEMIAEKVGCEIKEKANGALFGGDFTYIFGVLLPFIVKPSLWLANYVPAIFASTWYFKLQPLSKGK
jgi:2-polyprenyl-3-methyl-5-hydroxy-6-metoxy-1,4-benzoquinol methylase